MTTTFDDLLVKVEAMRVQIEAQRQDLDNIEFTIRGLLADAYMARAGVCKKPAVVKKPDCPGGAD